MSRTLIKDAMVVNEGQVQRASVLIESDTIAGIFTSDAPTADTVIDAAGKWLLPGVIDDHVHFRDPGLTHKADMSTESLAAAMGGVTTIFDMPNCVPQTVTLQTLQDKFDHAAETCLVNHSFYLGATHTNLDQIEKIDPAKVCGVKLFMGSSTGGMLLDDAASLKALFRAATVPVAVHCEETSIINANMERYVSQLGSEPPVKYHPLIRSEEACYASTSKALDVAAGTNVHLHILHLTTAHELNLFNNHPLQSKQFTAEACPAHLWFTDADYDHKGALIKCNPAIKTAADRQALRLALTDGRIDVIGTDHAPHLLSEKQGGCKSAASGMPVLPYSLISMLELASAGIMQMTDVVRLMCHNPAQIFSIRERGYIRQGYKADLTLVSRSEEGYKVSNANLPNKCGWTPFEGEQFHWKVCTTWVNGRAVYNEGKFDTEIKGKPVEFNRL
ncbi:MAG: dihydroorotase [Bacteroidaceae bacterium]|nr:dihydroorotase [Bacteroidaceae bacterium]